MRFLTFALALILLVANLALPVSVATGSSGCGGAAMVQDHCPLPGTGPARSQPADRFAAPCASCILPGQTALPTFDPGQEPVTFAETAQPVMTRGDSPLRRPPRPLS